MIKGWAWRRDIPNTSINVKIEITNSTTGQQYEPIIVLANIYRADVQQAGYGNGYHGYQINIDWGAYTPGTYTVRAYGQNSNGTFNELDCSPKTYTVAGYGQPLSDGEYYINNKEHGRYLHNTSSTINVASGTLNNLGSTIKWTLQKYNDGYVIMDTNSSKYLCVPSGNYETQNTSSRAVSSGKSVECIWDIVLSDTTGCVLRSRYNGRYLFSDGNTVYTSPEIGAANTSNRYTKTWRIVSTSAYGNSNSFDLQEMTPNTKGFVSAVKNKSESIKIKNPTANILWAEPSDFILSSTSSTTLTINSSNLTISGSTIGEFTAFLTHKVTNRSITVNVYICKFEHTINSYFDNGYCAFREQSAAACSEDINERVDKVAEYFAKIFFLKISRNNATLVTSDLDNCKVTIDSETIEEFCDCKDAVDHSVDANIFQYLNGIDNGGDEITSVFWTGHAFKIANIPNEQDRGSWLNNSILLSRKQTSLYDTLMFSSLFHEMCHEFGMEDHYHYEHTEDSNKKCSNVGCIKCNGLENKYSYNCIMFDSDIFYSYENLGYTAWLCSGCVDDISENIEERSKN